MKNEGQSVVEPVVSTPSFVMHVATCQGPMRGSHGGPGVWVFKDWGGVWFVERGSRAVGRGHISAVGRGEVWGPGEEFRFCAKCGRAIKGMALI